MKLIKKFTSLLEHLSSQIEETRKQLNTLTPKLSNFQTLVSESLKKVQNISKIWGSSDFSNRRILQRTIFPEGVFYDRQNHQ
jgi:site-specific DNA recombinase